MTHSPLPADDTPRGRSMPQPAYRGRFAPTPSGPLHLGSLLTALASWLCARAAGGSWLLRIDDLDAQRCDPAWAARILRQLEAHGLHWDETPRLQSQHVDAYTAALDLLRAHSLLYACDCSRARLRELGRSGDGSPVYDGHCRGRQLPFAQQALRLRVGGEAAGFDDGWQGPQHCVLQREVGDFVVRRRDGVAAYQLACAVDEHAQAITEVVRGADLLASTFMQREVLTALGLEAPAYRHLPVLVAADGRKLSKQNHARAIDEAGAARNLHRCLIWLGQAPPPELAAASATEVLAWAQAHWHPQRVSPGQCIKVEQVPSSLA